MGKVKTVDLTKEELQHVVVLGGEAILTFDYTTLVITEELYEELTGEGEDEDDE